jgi:predicted RNA-binding protein with PUA-like domain
MNYWLMKSEPDVFGIDHLADSPRKTAPWWGVRNYQARNYMRDQMKVGDQVLFYHSRCPEPGIAGIARVSRLAYPDETQFDRKSPYFDPKASRDLPRWFNVDVTLVKKTRVVGLPEMRSHAELKDMVILKRGNRLSITPVTEREWAFVMDLL